MLNVKLKEQCAIAVCYLLQAEVETVQVLHTCHLASLDSLVEPPS